jgi:2-polyprenyl-3-methyl-5-hydroxy-6-metoxy-1,4-benzoquinol methylase
MLAMVERQGFPTLAAHARATLRRRTRKMTASGMLDRHDTTREAQYRACLDDLRLRGFERLGLMSSESWRNDPRHLLFHFARYKFVAKMLAGRKRVLEVGCGDALGSRIVRQEVQALTATDFDPLFIEDAKQRMAPPWTFDVVVHDFDEGPIPGSFDGVYALDVLEHVPATAERQFLSAVFAALEPNGVAIIGMPSLESQSYASKQSREGHINCKSAPDLHGLMQEFFHNVFMFSMNDEVVHTGFHKMAHYLLALCCTKR